MGTDRRIKGVIIVLFLAIFLLAGRLCYIQVSCSRELSEGAAQQQMIPIIQKETELRFFDRNMTNMTAMTHAYYYLLERDHLTSESRRLLNLVGAQPAGTKGENYLVYRADLFSPSVNAALQREWNAYGFCVGNRDKEAQIANPLLEDLETIYEDRLQSETPACYLLGDAAGQPLSGTGILGESGDGAKETVAVQTTFDLEMQDHMEQKLNEVLKDEDAEGSVLIADAGTGQILVMASVGDATGDSEAGRNLTVEQTYAMDVFYDVIEDTAMAGRRSLVETAQLLGFGDPVFAAYPGEAEGVLELGNRGKGSLATPVQVCQMLVNLANENRTVPLSFLMSKAQDDGVPCILYPGRSQTQLEKLRKKIRENPLSGMGWMAGYGGDQDAYAIVVQTGGGASKEIFQAAVELAASIG